MTNPVKRERTLRAGYRGEVWQHGLLVASVEARSYGWVNSEIAHYAAMYGQDGPIETKIYSLAAARKKERK